MRRLLIACLAALAVVPVVAARAGEPAISIALHPNRAGRASQATVHASGAALRNQVPSSLVLSIERGFRIDPRSRAATCSHADADTSSCPDASRIGSGSLVLTVQGPLIPAPQDITVDLSAYLGARERRGDVSGVVLTARQQQFGVVRSVRGRLVSLRRGRFGYQARFDRLPSFTPPQGYSFALKSLDLTLGASRRAGRRRFALITNPRRCRGTWNAQVAVGYPDGSSQQTAVMTPCRR